MTHTIGRGLLAIVTLVLVASGCTSGGSGGESSQLRVALREDSGPLNFLNVNNDALLFLVHDRLVAPSPYATDPQPWLARDVRKIDPSTWEVSLRQGVRFHDGQEFTAQDVAFTVEFMKTADSGTYTHHTTTVPQIDRVEILDRYTVRFRCGYACPFLGSVTLAWLPMLPAHIWSQVDVPRNYTELAVGTGPYELVSYDEGQSYRFAANDDYFAGRPRVDELVMPIIPDPSTTFTALRSGEIDAASRQVPPELVGQFQRSNRINVASTTPLRYPEIRMNYQRPPFDRPAFRRALTRAVDKGELNRTVWLGRGRPATKGYPHPDSPWTNPNLATPYRPQAARQLLDGMGLTDTDGDGVRQGPNGRPLTFTLTVDGAEPTYVRAAQLVAEQLRAVGLGVRAQAVDSGTLDTLLESDNFDMYVNQITAHGTADPTQFIMSHFSGYLWDLPEVPYPAFMNLFREWKATETIQGRKRVSFRMQTLFNNQPTSIPLHYPAGAIAYRPQAYDGWAESPGYGLVHKWSLLPRQAARGANAVAAGPGR